jgi:hypothetical protein
MGSSVKGITMQGTFKDEFVTWTGWVLYTWDHACEVFLSKEKPQFCPTLEEWSVQGSTEFSPDILEACGIDPISEAKSEYDFFYGEESDGKGNHNPIEIEITLPKCLLVVYSI